jgi:hypothetical protein
MPYPQFDRERRTGRDVGGGAHGSGGGGTRGGKGGVFEQIDESARPWRGGAVETESRSEREREGGRERERWH